MMQIDEIKKEQQVEEDDEGPPPGWKPIHTPPQSQSPPRRPSNLGQIVCGSCHRLLAYQRGAKHVQCVSCQTVNIVLEADQVGQVKCGGCAVLLMYPYGAPQIRCSSCRFVTEIGAHNKRPPWSEQQRRPTLPKTAS